MKEGRTLQQIALELERQEQTKHDYVVPGTAMQMANGKLLLSNGHTTEYGLTELGHAQLAERAGIPKKYYDSIKTKHPDLLDYSVSYLLKANDERHLVRVLDGNVRAVRSNSYRILDNKPLLTSVLPVFMEAGFQAVSVEITPTRFYLKVISPRLQDEFKLRKPGTHEMINEVIQAGYWLQNSEVGHSRCSGGMFFNILRCTNGLMMSSEYGFAKNHSGKALDFDGAMEAYFSNQTRQLDDRAYWAKLRDIVHGMIGSPQGFKACIERFKVASEDRITGNPVKAAEKIEEVFSLSKDESSGVLKALIEGGDLSRWGVSNALTAYSANVADYDRATDFERMGGKVIELSPADWQGIALAA